MDNLIKFRAHHFLCSLAYQGNGYSPRFVANFDRIVQRIRSNEDTKIMIVAGLDDICSCCPHRQAKSNTCSDQITVTELDRAHAKILNLQHGDVISYGQAKKRLRTHMSIARFYDACASCEWQKSGLCEEALSELINNHEDSAKDL